jgi:MoxR-like ATPase
VAVLAGRPSVGFEDVREVALSALNHRILLNYKAKFEGITPGNVLNDVLKNTSETELEFAGEIEIEASGK